MVFLEAIKSLSINDIYVIITGVVMGTAARLITLKVDFRQVPSYPSAYFNNVVLGLIASALGAIAIPAILTRDFAAVTFLTVAVQQFRDVRTTERESLAKLEHTEYVKRGEAYIDGISKTFESRNYISLVTALLSVLLMKIFLFLDIVYAISIGVATGFCVIFLCHRFTKGKTIGAICNVHIGRIAIRGAELYVDDMFLTNHLGTDQSKSFFRNNGIAIVLEPKSQENRITLDNYGQRQAIFYEAVRALGVIRYSYMRKNFSSGKILLAFIPIVNDPNKAIRAIMNTPILENSRKISRIMKKPLEN